MTYMVWCTQQAQSALKGAAQSRAGRVHRLWRPLSAAIGSLAHAACVASSVWVLDWLSANLSFSCSCSSLRVYAVGMSLRRRTADALVLGIVFSCTDSVATLQVGGAQGSMACSPCRRLPVFAP